MMLIFDKVELMTFEEAEIQRIQSEIEKNRAERDKYRREAQEISRRLNRKWYQSGQNIQHETTDPKGKHETYWKDLNLRKKPLEEYYRQF